MNMSIVNGRQNNPRELKYETSSFVVLKSAIIFFLSYNFLKTLPSGIQNKLYVLIDFKF